MAVAPARRRRTARLQVPRVRVAVQDGHQPAVLVGADTQGQADGAAGVHRRGDPGGPGRERHHDSAARGGGVRRRRGQPDGRPSAPRRTGPAQRAGVRNDTFRHLPGGHAAAVRPAVQRGPAGHGRRAVLDQAGVELVRPGGGQTAAGRGRSARDEPERRVEATAVAAQRHELCARTHVPVANVQLELFEERQQQSAGNEVGQKQFGRKTPPSAPFPTPAFLDPWVAVRFRMSLKYDVSTSPVRHSFKTNAFFLNTFFSSVLHL